MHLEGETQRLCPLIQIHCLVLGHYFKVTTKDHLFPKQVTFRLSLYHLWGFFPPQKPKKNGYILLTSQFKLNKQINRTENSQKLLRK